MKTKKTPDLGLKLKNNNNNFSQPSTLLQFKPQLKKRNTFCSKIDTDNEIKLDKKKSFHIIEEHHQTSMIQQISPILELDEIDKENFKNPQLVSMYAKEIFNYMASVEVIN